MKKLLCCSILLATTTMTGTAMADQLEVKRWNPKGLSQPQGYSQVVTIKGDRKEIRLGGKAGLDANNKIPESLADQVKLTFDNITLALKDAGAEPKDVVEIQVFIVDLDKVDPKPVYDAITNYFPAGHKPVSMVIGVSALAIPALKFEINVVAVVAESK
ncbi:MAG: RidA family protein [Rhodospirillaceae bacterium]|nr:RidA family protein [Rhodospirillaceae bacterium]